MRNFVDTFSYASLQGEGDVLDRDLRADGLRLRHPQLQRPLDHLRPLQHEDGHQLLPGRHGAHRPHHVSPQLSSKPLLHHGEVRKCWKEKYP